MPGPGAETWTSQQRPRYHSTYLYGISHPALDVPCKGAAGWVVGRVAGRQPFSENESNLVNKNSRGALSRGHQHSAVGRAPIPDSSDTSVSVS